MQAPYLSEMQVLRQNTWILPLIAITIVGPLIPLGIGLHTQLIKQEPWGDKPMSDEGLIGLFVFIVINIGFVVWILLSVKLETKIDVEGVHYRFFPHQFRWKLITPQEILSYTVRDRFDFFESGGIGYHRNWFIKTRSMRIHGPHNLRIELTNGQKLIIGTQNPEGMEWAMKRLLNKKEIF